MPLRDRIGQLPVVIAGPILRRVERDAVTVWVALKESRTVTLQVFSSDGTTLRFASPPRATVPIGSFLHVVALTARPTLAQAPLSPGEMYYYNLGFGGGVNLGSSGILGGDGIRRVAYEVAGKPLLPGFAMPPADLNDLRIVHGSCRKPHGPRLDAMRALDVFLQTDAHDPVKRPHQLYLTGDQIYADDVAEMILHIITDAGDVLLNRDAAPTSAERLPGFADATFPASLRPGTRHDAIANVAGFTGSTPSHLMGLGEFCAMYLLVWSDVLWPSTLPTFQEVFGKAETVGDPPKPAPELTGYSNQLRPVVPFVRSLPRIRRALANVPSYMMADDHEITDDWNLHRKWAEKVFGKPLAKRILQNGLTAFTLFQAWGNTPADFDVNTPGAAFLGAVGAWTAAGFPASSTELQLIQSRLPLPPDIPDFTAEDLPLSDPSKIKFHFSIAWDKHQLIVFDTRNWRSFPKSTPLRTVLFTEEGLFQNLLNLPAPNPDGVTIVVFPGPVPVVPVVDWAFGLVFTFARWFPSHAEKISYDLDGRLEGLSLDPGIYERTFARLATRRPGTGGPRRERYVFLSGDVHHGFVAGHQYWATRPPLEPAQPPQRADAAIAHLTSSALQNETTFRSISLTDLLHKHGFEFDVFGNDVPDPIQRLTWILEPTDPQTGRLEVGTKRVLAFPGRLKAPIERQGRLAIMEDSGQQVGFFTAATVTRPPDVVSRSQMIASSDERAPPAGVIAINAEPPGDPAQRQARLQTLLNAANNHAFPYARSTAPGKQVVGVNQISVVRLEGFAPGQPESAKAVVQEMWWWIDETAELFAADADPTTEKIAAPLSRFRVPLAIDPPPVIGDLK